MAGTNGLLKIIDAASGTQIIAFTGLTGTIQGIGVGTHKIAFSADGMRLYYGDGMVVHKMPSVATPTPTPTPRHIPTPTPQPTVTLNLTVSLSARPA